MRCARYAALKTRSKVIAARWYSRQRSMTRTARVALTEFDETTAELWLTVAQPAKK